MENTSEVSPFRLDVAEDDLRDLRDRLARTRWPDELPGVGWDYGIPLEYVKELAEYWRTSFTTTLDRANVHFIHAHCGNSLRRASCLRQS